MIMNGSSTGCPPIHVRIAVLAIKDQKKIFAMGRNMRERSLEVWMRGIKKRIRIEKRRARTPPSLLGIERRIA